MKKTIIIITILLLPIVLGIKGGETWTYNFPYCEWLAVNITGNLTIDSGEYTVHNDCENISENYYKCNCSNDFNFNISFAVNAVNVYELSFNYNYSKEVAEEKETSSSGSSGGSGGGSGRLITGLTKGSKTVTLNYGDVFSFYIGSSKHRIIILKVTASEIKIRIYSRAIELTMKEGEAREVDVDDDGLTDFLIELKEIKKIGGLFKFTVIEEVAAVEKKKETEIVINKTSTETKIISETIIDDGVEPVEVKEPKFLIGILIIVGVLVVSGGLYFLYIKKFKKGKWEDEK